MLGRNIRQNYRGSPTRIIETVKINRREERNRAATGLTAFHEDETFGGRGIGSLNRSADEKIPAYA